MSLSQRTATLRLSVSSSHNLIRSEPSILDRNSKGIPVSVLENFGIKKFKDRSLWTVGVPTETRSLSHRNSALVSANLACRHASAMFRGAVSIF